MTITPQIWSSFASIDSAFNETDPSITQLSNGNILVARVSSDPNGAGSDSGLDIIGRIYDPLGNVVVSDFKLNTVRFADDEQQVEVVALDGPSAGFMVVYNDIDTTGGNDIFAELFFNNGAHDQALTIYDNTAGETVANPQVAQSSATSALVTYELETATTSFLLGKIVDPQNGTVGSEFTIATDSTGSFDGITSSDVAVLQNGNYVIAWSQGNTNPTNDEIYFEIRDPAGTLIVVDTLVSQNFLTEIQVSVEAKSNGGFVISWTADASSSGNGFDVEARHYDASGNSLSGIITVPTTRTDDQTQSAVVGLDDGGWIVFWADEHLNDAVKGQRYNASGTKVGTDFTVKGFTTGRELEATLLDDGRVAVTFRKQGTLSVETVIVDPRTMANAPDANGYVIGTVNDDFIDIQTGTKEIYTHDGDDTVLVQQGDDSFVNELDFGLGLNDTLLIAAEAGTYNFTPSGIGVSDFDRLEFEISGVPSVDRTLEMEAADFSDLDFIIFDNSADSRERIEIEMGIETTLDLSPVVISTNYQQFLDEIVIIGDGSDETVTGSAVGETFQMGAGDDTVDGGFGDDYIYGGDDDDTLNGGAGADWISGGGGQDTMDGGDAGAGVDTIDLSQDGYLESVFFNMESGALLGGQGFEIALNFERVFATDFGDNIIGSDRDDAIFGRSGNDTLRGGLGADGLYGGDDDDTLIVEAADLADGPEQFNGGETLADGTTPDNDILRVQGTENVDLTTHEVTDIEQLEISAGIQVTVNQSQIGNRLEGGPVLFIPVEGFASNLAVQGDSGIETFNIILDEGNKPLDLSGFTFNLWASSNADFIQNDRIQIVGDANDNTIIGSAGTDFFIDLSGGNHTLNMGEGQDAVAILGGNDDIRLGAGDDVVAAGTGIDFVDGEAGSDTISYTGSSARVNVQLQYNVAIGGHAQNDTLRNMENIIGSNYNDNLVGNAASNKLEGGIGNDTLRGLNGADHLDGGEGDDWLYIDHLDTFVMGGVGLDRVSVASNQGVVLDVAAAQVEIARGNVGNDLFDASGYPTFNDGTISFPVTLYGLSGNDTLIGSDANDKLFGDAGADQLSGGGGNDFLYVDADDTFIDAGAGLQDRVIVTNLVGQPAAASSVNLDLQVSGVEIAFGNIGNDVFDGSNSTSALSLYGRSGQDTLLGGSANDRLFGDGNTAGGDTLNGGRGDDFLRGGTNTGGWAERDQFVFDEDWGNDRIFDFADNGFEKIDFSSIAGITSRSDLTITDVTDASGSYANITYTDTGGWSGSVRVYNVLEADLGNNDFIFV